MCVYTENALYTGVQTLYIGVYKGVFTVYTVLFSQGFMGSEVGQKPLASKVFFHLSLLEG